MANFNPSRRAFLVQCSAGAPVAGNLPWLRSADDLFSKCTRCERCIDACPEAIVRRGDGGYPVIDFNQGPCTFCGACADSCPEDVFVERRFSRPWRQVATVGGSCLAHGGIYCQSCQDACESRAIRFRYAAGAIPKPTIVTSECTGCGACVAVCPPHAMRIQPGA